MKLPSDTAVVLGIGVAIVAATIVDRFVSVPV